MVVNGLVFGRTIPLKTPTASKEQEVTGEPWRRGKYTYGNVNFSTLKY